MLAASINKSRLQVSTNMIFQSHQDTSGCFTKSQLIAINIYGYLKSHTKQECDDSVGCDVYDFEIEPSILNMALYLHNADPVNLDAPVLEPLLDADHLKELNCAIEKSLEGNEALNNPKILTGFNLICILGLEKAQLIDDLRNEDDEVDNQIAILFGNMDSYMEEAKQGIHAK